MRGIRRKAAPIADGRPRPVPRTRAAGAWVGLVASALVLLLLLIFILQNGQRSEIHFLGWDGRLPMGVALLLAAVVGALAAAVPATVRIVQLRHLAVRRDAVVPPPRDTTEDRPTTADQPATTDHPATDDRPAAGQPAAADRPTNGGPTTASDRPATDPDGRPA